jgi:hypothetical protein
VWKDMPITEKADILATELYCARFGACRGHCVLAGT